MTHKLTELVAASPPDSPPPHPSLPPPTQDSLHCQYAQKPTPPPPQAYNHTPSTLSDTLPHLSVPLQPIPFISSYSLPLPLSRSTNFRGAGSHMTSQDDHMMSHMTLRRRDLQGASVQPALTTTSLNDKLIRPKIRHQVVTNGNCSPPAGIKKLTQLPLTSKQGEPVFKTGNSPPATSGPARNLRFRPYSQGKT